MEGRQYGDLNSENKDFTTTQRDKFQDLELFYARSDSILWCLPSCAILH